MATRLETIEAGIIRYGLVILLLWIGMFKFTAYESEGVKKLAENSPFLSWVYNVMSVRGFSMVLGSIEIILGILIASRAISPKGFIHRQHWSNGNVFNNIILSIFHTWCMATRIWVPFSIT